MQTRKYRLILLGLSTVFLIALAAGASRAKEDKAEIRSNQLSLADENIALKKRIQELERDNSVLESMLSLRQAEMRQPALAERGEKSPDKVIHVNLGFAYGIKGRIEEAIDEYRKALEYDPKDKDIHYNLGLLLSRKNRHKEAIEEYKKSIKGTAEDKEVYYNMAVIYSTGMKDKNTAAEYFQKFLEIASGNR